MILFSRNLKEKNLDCQVQVQQAGMTGVITGLNIQKPEQFLS